MEKLEKIIALGYELRVDHENKDNPNTKVLMKVVMIVEMI